MTPPRSSRARNPSGTPATVGPLDPLPKRPYRDMLPQPSGSVRTPVEEKCRIQSELAWVERRWNSSIEPELFCRSILRLQ